MTAVFRSAGTVNIGRYISSKWYVTFDCFTVKFNIFVIETAHEGHAIQFEGFIPYDCFPLAAAHVTAHWPLILRAVA